jgi:hypothetical protein
VHIASFGPLFWALVIVIFLAGMGAAFITIDVVRRAWFRGSLPAEPFRWWYLAPQAVYFVLMMLGQIHALPIGVTGTVVLCTPLALGQQATYLLRIVFPKPTGIAEEDFELLADGGDTIEPESELPHGS